jgi:asparagine synthase (glutamine-hydrolysing)
MCGVAGLIRVSDGGPSVDAERLVRHMCDAQAHRGPDDSGVTDLGRVCLGSRRLSIIDLSAAGHMPMSDAAGRWWIAYNGEVYNFAEIRTELEALGHRFRSSTDTEVVLHSWMQWGVDCLQRFVGMFAFAIHDTQSDEVVLVRDRYGKKPLYYAGTGGIVAFASEMKALVLGRSGLKLDEQSLAEWMLYRNVDALRARTLIEDVRSVLPGEVVTISPRGISASQYYVSARHVDEASYRHFEGIGVPAVIDEIDRLLNESVQLRLIADVPVGTLLSGGLDSSLVTAIAAKYTKELTTFHVSVSGYAKLDEFRYAKQLADAHGLPFVPLRLTGETFRRALPRVTWHEDLPLTHPNSTAYYLISQVAREHGVPVVLSGEGADELFGGYSWNYRRRRLLLALAPLLRAVPPKVYSILELLVYAHAGMPVEGHRFRDLLPPTVELLDRCARAGLQSQGREAYAFLRHDTHERVQGAMLADVSDFLVPLLRRLDRTSMGASVESRVPFLDHRLVHAAINLPLHFKVATRTDKWVLKQVALRYMPRNLVFRKKAGFPLPVDDYIAPMANREFFAGGFCENALGLGPQGITQVLSTWRRHTHGLFGLIALEMWGRMFLLGQSVEEVEGLVDASERRLA